jgi:ABC-type transporter Mla subunit MlaD
MISINVPNEVIKALQNNVPSGNTKIQNETEFYAILKDIDTALQAYSQQLSNLGHSFQECSLAYSMNWSSAINVLNRYI